MKADDYKLFKDMKEDNNYNFYGVIFESTFPVLIDSGNNQVYETKLKLIDPSFNFLSNPSGFLTLIIKSSNKDAMPFIHSIGDIIRIHNANYSANLCTANLYLTNITKITTHWSVFSGNDTKSNNNSLVPLQSSDFNTSINEEDRLIVRSMQKWIKCNLKLENSLMFKDDIKLCNINIGLDLCFNSLVQIECKIEYDNEIVYVIQDDTKRCVVCTSKYFNFFNKGNIIRMVNYSIDNGSNIIFKKNTNAMLLPQYTILHKELSSDINKKIGFLNKYYDIKTLTYKSNNNVNNINKKQESQIKNINDIYTSYIELKEIKKNVSINDLNGYSFDKDGLLFIKFIKIIYPCNIPQCIVRIENNIVYFNIVFLCEEQITKKEIILHLNNYDQEGNGLLYDNKLSDESDIINAISTNISKIIKEQLVLKIQVEYIKLNMVDNKGNVKNETNSNLGVYRIVGKYFNKQ